MTFSLQEEKTGYHTRKESLAPPLSPVSAQAAASAGPTGLSLDFAKRELGDPSQRQGKGASASATLLSICSVVLIYLDLRLNSENSDASRLPLLTTGLSLDFPKKRELDDRPMRVILTFSNFLFRFMF